MTRRARLGGAVLGLLITAASPAAEIGAANRTPDPTAAVLLAQTGTGRTSFTLREIEALGLHSVKTRSPWEKGVFSFEGVLLSDFLKLAGLDGAPAILARASDGYTQVIPRADWTSAPLLLATREDGRPLTRRTQGPIRLVYPITDHPELDTPIHKQRWVWLLKSIEAVSR